MKRALPALVVTLLGLLALASFKTSPGLPTKSSAAPTDKSTVPATSAPPPGSSSTTPPTSPGSDNGTGPATSPPTTSSNAVRTIDGDPFDNNYGTVQVRVTLQGNRITDVTPLQMPFDRRRSAEISQQAAPLLLQEVLQAQSARINILGGASYTSESYAQSLQSALDKAGA
jgi:uncharacterized protein with FMN-binding domain